MRLRKPVLFLLLVTVLSPIVLYTHTLATYFASSSSRNEFDEEVSTFTLGGEIRPLNVLPQVSVSLIFFIWGNMQFLTLFFFLFSWLPLFLFHVLPFQLIFFF
nr:probable galacturonosyltransferase 4 isoform X1 [Ipomoea batatas]